MGSFGIIKNGKKQIITGVGGGGGHVIQDADGADLAQRDTLQFGGYLQAMDDSTNEKTVVSDEPTEVTWSAWQEMTDAQKEGTKWLITDVPDADGSISADLLTKLWENPSPTSAFTAQTITLNSADYDFLIIIYKLINNASYQESVIIQKGNGAVLDIAYSSGSAVLNYHRLASYVSDISLSFDDCYLTLTSGTQVVNTSNVPIAIYGIKKTITVTFDAIASDVSTLASKCMLSDDVTSVEDAIDEIHADKLGDFTTTSDVAISGVTYHTYWEVAPTASNKVYGVAVHPTNGKLTRIYNNKGTYTAVSYDANTTTGDGIKTKVAKTGTAQSAITSTISAGTTLDNAIGTLLNNDATLNADMFKRPTGFDWTNKDQLTSGVEYTVPSNGFIRLVCGRTNGNNVALNILGTTVATMSYCTGMTQATSLLQLIPVYKGWKCTFSASNTTDGSSAQFAPYTYS